MAAALAADPEISRGSYHERAFPCRLGPVQGLAALFRGSCSFFGCGRSSSLSLGGGGGGERGGFWTCVGGLGAIGATEAGRGRWKR